MTKFEILNTASELRRAAKWLYRDQKEKLPLIKKIIREAKTSSETKKVLDHFGVTENFRNRIWLAEQLLVSSVRLQNISNNF